MRVAFIQLISISFLLTFTFVSSSNTLHNHVIDNVLKTLKTDANETMVRNHKLFCERRTYKTDAALGYAGCASYIIEEAYCVGQCSTIYLPGQGSGALSCSMCDIKRRSVKTIKLHCNSGIREIQVPIIEECACKACQVTNKIPEPPWKTTTKKERKLLRKLREKRKRKPKNKTRTSQANLNELNTKLTKREKAKLRLRRIKKRNKRRKNKILKRRRKKYRSKRFRFLLKEEVEKRKMKEKKGKKKKKRVLTYDELVRLMFSWT